MSVIVFSALGFVFVVNVGNGKVAQFTVAEAIVLANYFNSLAGEAMIDLVLTYNEEYLDEANDLVDLADALYQSAVESIFG